MVKNNLKYLIFILMTGMFSCQPIEILDEVVFDYNQFLLMDLSAEKKK